MKKLYFFCSIIFLIAVLSACSQFINVEEVQKQADLAFGDKNFEEFNNLILKLEEKDVEAAKLYIDSIKEHDYLQGKSLEILNKIKSEVPSLKDYADSKITDIEYSNLVKSVISNLSPDIEEILEPFSDVNKTIYLIEHWKK